MLRESPSEDEKRRSLATIPPPPNSNTVLARVVRRTFFGPETERNTAVSRTPP